MKVCGIISEYNPLHNGHLYHIDQTKKLLGENTIIVCVMSGNYVQRGDLAIYEKYFRAQSAIQSGIDLVLEMPLTACLSSAEKFAFGAVHLLEKLGCVTNLSFGSENGNIKEILKCCSLYESENVQTTINKNIKKGMSYAHAIQMSMENIDKKSAQLFSSPNNTLGISYCMALKQLKSNIIPITIKRKGANHDTQSTLYNMPSASFLRDITQKNKYELCEQFMPQSSFKNLLNQIEKNCAPVLIKNIDLAIISHLRRLTADELNLYCGGFDGLNNRLFNAIQSQTNFNAICEYAKTKRYPLARIRRSIIRAWLNLDYNLKVTPDYIKILGANENGRFLLKQIKKTCNLPIITKPSCKKNLSENALKTFNREKLADDLYYLAIPNENMHVGGNSLRKTPFIT